MNRRVSLILSVLFSLTVLLRGAYPQEVFFGNLHSHTSYSDGSGTPEEAYRHARDVAGLHFLAITEHNHQQAESGAADDRRDGILIATDHSLYIGPQPEALIPTANRLSEDGNFVALYGQEFSSISQGNHINVFEIGSVITAGNGKFSDLITSLASNLDSAGNPPIIQLNHPSLFSNGTTEYGADDFGTKAQWITMMGRHATLIEIANGPAMTKESGQRPGEIMESDFKHYLNLGFHLAPTANQDNHYRTWGTATDARTAVVADSLSKANLLDALRKRRVYATEDRNLRVIFKVNGNLMGEIVKQMPVTGALLQIEFSITDDDEPNSAYLVELFSDSGAGGNVAQVIETVQVQGNTAANTVERIDGITFSGPGQYLFLKVRQIDEDGVDDRVWTAPVWFEPESFIGTPLANVRIMGLLPNPAGNEAENEEVTIGNQGTQQVSMVGWRLRDLAQQHWILDSLGALQSGESKTILRAGQPMVMNNNGDSISLIDPSGNSVQTVTYSQVGQGVRVTPE
jgi:hypothetical protein